MALSKVNPNFVSQTPYGRRNLIINGAMQVAQRGTSVTGVTGTGYPSVDRYNMNLVSLGTWTVSQSTTAPTGFTNSTKLDCTTADATAASSSYFLFEQRIEAQNLQHLAYGTSSAKSMTLSFWVRSNKTGTYYTEVQHGDAGSNYFNNHSYTISSANTWEKKIIPVTGQTAAIINNDNGIGMFVRWCIGHDSTGTSGTTTNNTWHQTTANRFAGSVNLADSTNNEWYITGIQLEVGEQATPFEHRPFGDELAACQRYFTKFSYLDGDYARVGWMIATSSTAGRGSIRLPTTMRTAPSSAMTGTPRIEGTSAKNLNGLGQSGNSSTNNLGVDPSFDSHGSAGDVYHIDTGPNGGIECDAEL
jgi:hypothetical protein